MRKAPEAFRTISEAADALDTPAHVLRFWESKFSQVKPVKRAGGRSYYRPADIDLLSGIKLLLHDQGMTIRGVQKLLQDKGARHVAAMAPLGDDVLDGEVTPPVVIAANDPDPQATGADAAESVPEPTPPAPETAATAQDDAASATDTSGPAVAEDRPVPPTEDTPDAEPASEQVEDSEPDATEPEETPDTVNIPDAADATELPAAQPSETDIPDIAAAPVPDINDKAEDVPQDTPEAARIEDDQPVDTGPEPALAPLLEAGTAQAGPIRFAGIAHALRTAPPSNADSYAAAMARLETLVQKMAARDG
ncbi:hypothetical protein ROE7235_02264 [Roseibaca ekhonensis]|uniref:HTH merR-type domain-containing protein n=1 Tax=Roseinatronobacter ekhonensis TaxID=254356 RepID=A0A3B0MA07_9RHOB|nr:MerR family transcriptional regulator [Roseibaca ekhonensis]SUZ32503.1 hypothetical protein ROE7235_02264 [Roseibaca ekhonensis]